MPVGINFDSGSMFRAADNTQELSELRVYMSRVPAMLEKMSSYMQSFTAHFDVLAACHVIIPPVSEFSH